MFVCVVLDERKEGWQNKKKITRIYTHVQTDDRPCPHNTKAQTLIRQWGVKLIYTIKEKEEIKTLPCGIKKNKNYFFLFQGFKSTYYNKFSFFPDAERQIFFFVNIVYAKKIHELTVFALK